MEKMEAYLNPDLSIDVRVEDLLERMTLEEKIIQLDAKGTNISTKLFSDLFEGMSQVERREIEGLFVQTLYQKENTIEIMANNFWEKNWKDRVMENDECPIGQLSNALRFLSPEESAVFANKIQRFAHEKARLSIPVLIHDECLHGCIAKGCTIFPQAIALAASWDPELMFEAASAIGKETRARGIHQGLSPTINIVRDPRCGRTEETYGEDPFLTTKMAVSYVKGLQSKKVVATLKHFAANFVGDGGRDSNAVHISERHLREIYFPAFKACIQKANALSVMAAYNSIDGMPCHCNRVILTDILRKEWGFKGFVVSDYFAVFRLKVLHKIVSTKAEAAKRAIEAGMDIELPESDCFKELVTMVRDGELDEKVVDESVRRILRVKFWLGLFDNMYVDPDYAGKACGCEEHRNLAFKAARKSMVLLKNDGILPLSHKLNAVAVMGPNANKVRLGGYSGYGVNVITPLEGMRNKAAENTKVYYTEGCKLTGTDTEGFEEAVNLAHKSNMVVLFLGNSSPGTEGEQRDRSNLDLPGVQEDLIKAVYRTGTPLVVVLINGSAITMSKWIHKAGAVIEAWYPGEEGGNAIADILFGSYNPGGKLPLTFPKTVGQLPLYYNYKPTGRINNYVDLREDQTLFPFGHGLSYTKFEYSNLIIDPEVIGRDQNVSISVTIGNTGKYKGDEVVQLYVHDTVASRTRPEKELKGFKRITLDTGEKKTVKFTITEEDLQFLDNNMNLIVEPGSFEIMVGSSSEDIRLEGGFTVK
ncbi:MAG: glycoside hydrolase family 3 C-terminal domain-containing protein [Spirochaetales bacterium]|nr:glycoside hydrolase family 3 C-terminal domain-containing protein [Spirochaetales bacterium]